MIIENYRLDRIKRSAKRHKWYEISRNGNIHLISFKKEKDRINVYYSTMTVATCIDHPKKGKTQLFRRNVSYTLLDLLFENPRIHTGLGYYTKDRYCIHNLNAKNSHSRLNNRFRATQSPIHISK